jgi:hypothetical protein
MTMIIIELLVVCRGNIVGIGYGGGVDGDDENIYIERWRFARRFVSAC